jgi:hypothetical protein
MGSNRGKKSNKRGKLAWGNRKANRGRRPALHTKKGMVTWKEVRATMLRKATVIVTPEKKADEAPAAAE